MAMKYHIQDLVSHCVQLQGTVCFEETKLKVFVRLQVLPLQGQLERSVQIFGPGLLVQQML